MNNAYLSLLRHATILQVALQGYGSGDPSFLPTVQRYLSSDGSKLVIPPGQGYINPDVEPPLPVA